MARSVFYSFHFDRDFSRTQLVRNLGAINGNQVATANKWEEVKRNGDAAIKSWIKTNLTGKTCLVVLAGSHTANRKWINFEIEEAWRRGLGVTCMNIHKLKDLAGNQSSLGANPLYYATSASGNRISTLANRYDPPRETSKGVYAWIENYLPAAIDEAIAARK
ncbi:MAG: hypothetical protein ACJAUS_001940 [Qipengyuania sp.]|jgi:hypothetical protein